MRTLQVAFAVTLLMLLAVPASAVPALYDNTTTLDNYMDDGFTINYGYSVTDSFVLSGPATVTGVNFVVWEFLGSNLTVHHLHSLRWHHVRIWRLDAYNPEFHRNKRLWVYHRLRELFDSECFSGRGYVLAPARKRG